MIFGHWIKALPAKFLPRIHKAFVLTACCKQAVQILPADALVSNNDHQLDRYTVQA